MKKNYKYAIAALLVSVTSLVALVACGTSNAAEVTNVSEKVDEHELAAREVRVSQAVNGNVYEMVTRVSTITAPNTVQLLPKTSGQIISLYVEEGDDVATNQVVAKIESEQLDLEYKKAKSAAQKAEHDLDLARRQYEAQVIGKENFLLAEHKAKQANKDLEQARIELEKCDVRAPISGVVSSRFVSRGDMVFTSTPLVTITDLSLLEADVLIPQDQIDKISVGQQVVFRPSGDNKREFSGHINRISPVIETQTGTIKAVARVDGMQQQARPGQFVKVDVITGLRENAILIPKEAIVVENAMNVIYKVVDGYARRIPVEIGFPGQGRIQVLGQVSDGDQIVISGISGLDDMAKVKILPSLQESESTYAAVK